MNEEILNQILLEIREMKDSNNQRFESIDQRFDEMKEYIDQGLNKVVKEVAQEFRNVTDFIYERQNKMFEALDKKTDDRIKELKNNLKKGLQEIEKAVS